MNYEQRIVHFESGYANSQAAVRFLDTKASAVVGVIPIVLVLAAKVYLWLDERQGWNDQPWSSYECGSKMIWFGVILAALWLIGEAVAAVWWAFGALSPQKPVDGRPSLIFPHTTTDPPSEPKWDTDFNERAAYFVDRATQADALEDYRRQVVRMSEIVARKIKYVKRAVGETKRFFLAAALVLILLVVQAWVSPSFTPDKAGATQNATPQPPTASP